MKRIVLILSITTVFNSQAQADFAIHAGAGTGYIANSATVNMNHLYYGSPLRSYPKMSYEAGIKGIYYFEKTSLSLDVNYFQINGQQEENTFGPATEYPFSGGNIYVEKERKIGYLSLPVMIHRDYEKFSIGGGIQTQFTTHVKEMKKMWTGYSQENNSTLEEDNRTITKFDVGLAGQINAKASKRLSVNFKVYWGLWNVNNFEEKGAFYEFYGYENPVVDRKLKHRQFVITAQYNIFGRKQS